MTYLDAVAAVEQKLRAQGWSMAATVARDMNSRRRTSSDPGSGIEYGQEHAIVSHAAHNILRDHFTRETAGMSILERIAYVRALPNTQLDPVERARTHAVESVLDATFPGVADDAIDAYTGPGDGWPAYLADAYARAAAAS